MAAFVVFGMSLAGIVILFAGKMWEDSRGRVVAPELRRRADAVALGLRSLAVRGVYALEHLPTFGAALLRWIVHVIAVAVARLARAAERYAHAVAELVSHKHRIERREVRSAYVHQMVQRKRRLKVSSESEIEQAS